MTAYTEQQIRGLAINFLRFHYKLRPRYAGGGTRIVDRPHYYKGVLIDARLAYQRPDRTFFTATIEATSVDQQQEILYVVNYFRVVVHALVLTLLIGAITIWALTLLPAYSFDGETAAIVDEGIWAGSRVQGFNLWRAFGRPAVYSVLVSGFLLTFGLIGVLLSRWRVYRYIYAVDQFKHFFADAQWVAYDERIFDEKSRRRRRQYRELHRQCVRWGFGLLAVEEDRVVRIVIAPSQVDQFGGGRVQLPRWISAIEQQPASLVGMLRRGGPVKAKPQLPPPPEELADPLAIDPYLDLPRREEAQAVAVKAKPGRPKFYERPDRKLALVRARTRRAYRSLFAGRLRRRPGYYELGTWVFVVGLVSLSLVSWALYRQSYYRPVAEEGAPDAAQSLDPLESESNPVPYLDIEEGEFRRDDDPFFLESNDEVRLLKLSTSGRITTEYDCVPLYLLDRRLYLAVAGRYSTYGAARSRAEAINRTYEVPVTVALGACVSLAEEDYLVYLGEATENEGTANFLVRSYGLGSQLEVEILEIN